MGFKMVSFQKWTEIFLLNGNIPSRYGLVFGVSLLSGLSMVACADKEDDSNLNNDSGTVSWDTYAPPLDSDFDGVSVSEGDCDDENPEVPRPKRPKPRMAISTSIPVSKTVARNTIPAREGWSVEGLRRRSIDFPHRRRYKFRPGVPLYYYTRTSEDR